MNLRTRSTDALLGAVAKVLGDEGIELISSTAFLEPLLAEEGVLTERAPDEEECQNIEYGLGVAQALAGFDIGQTVVVAAQACVAVEAMEGTDATIERAGRLMQSLESGAQPIDTARDACGSTVVKVAKPNQDMRFDVPVIGIATVETMIRAGASCLSVEAGRTLLFDRDATAEARQRRRALPLWRPRADNDGSRRSDQRSSPVCSDSPSSARFPVPLFPSPGGFSMKKLLLFALAAAVRCRACHSSLPARPTTPCPQGQAPTFTLPSQDGAPISLDQLSRQVGGALLLSQGHDHWLHHRGAQLPDALAQFEAKNAVILGVSVDTADSHSSSAPRMG